MDKCRDLQRYDHEPAAAATSGVADAQVLQLFLKFISNKYPVFTKGRHKIV